MIISLAYGIFISLAAFAQDWQSPQLPQAPQPLFFTPAMQLPVLTGSNVQNKQLRKVAERRMVQDEVNEASEPRHERRAATPPGGPGAVGYLQAYNELNNALTGVNA